MTRSLALLLLFLFPLAFSPGPGNIFFSAHGAAFGLRRSLRALLGYHLATWGISVMIGLGLRAILLRHPALTQWVQHLDRAYVLWLAWNMIRSGLTLNQHTAHAAGFMQGVWLLLLNPKGYAIMVLMFSQFQPVDPDRPILWVMGISLLFTLNNLVAFTLWTLAGAAVAQGWSKAHHATRLQVGCRLCLAGVGLWLILMRLP